MRCGADKSVTVVRPIGPMRVVLPTWMRTWLVSAEIVLVNYVGCLLFVGPDLC